MASVFKLSGTPGQTVDRRLYLVYGNAGTYESPEWSVMGKRVEDSSAEEDWSEEWQTTFARLTELSLTFQSKS